MSTVTYTVFDGEVISEDRDGAERDYLPDPLGSTLALLDNTQAQTDTFTYWPYGEERSRNGTTPTPFCFLGTAGYYRDSSATSYVRHRNLDRQKGRWLESETGFPGNAYPYAKLNPATISAEAGFAWLLDRKGDRPGTVKKKGCPGADALKWVRDLLSKNKKCRDAFLKYCKKGLDGALELTGGDEAFVINKLCKPHADACTDTLGGSETSKCNPTTICFNESLCKKDARSRGEALLWELTNYCDCYNRKGPVDRNESAAKEVGRACGLRGGPGGATRT
jgi:hypothetical protein